ncbi:MAG: M28 family peptidase [Spirochaetota bacterium]
MSNSNYLKPKVIRFSTFKKLCFITKVLFLLSLYLLFFCTPQKEKKVETKEPEVTQTPPTQEDHTSISANRLKKTVKFLSSMKPARNFYHVESLNKAAEFISREFQKANLQTFEQKFVVSHKEYKNIIATLGPPSAPRIVVGAHYDVYGNYQGADDNASGIAGLLELARVSAPLSQKLKYRIDFVAYTLEEPPNFRTTSMGSYVHASDLQRQGVEVLGMLALEMIGYFSQEANSQRYPIAAMKYIYPSTGNYIAIVGNEASANMVGHFERYMKKTSVRVESLIAPESIQGVDFSDHLNYWAKGYRAIMITDTAFFRNPNYHQSTDTPETLNYKKMAELLNGVYMGIRDFSIEK